MGLQSSIETIELLLAITLELVGVLKADHANLEAVVRDIWRLPNKAVVVLQEIYTP